MVGRVFRLSFLWVLLLLGACSSRQQDLLIEYRSLISLKEYSKAHEVLEKLKIQNDPKNRLLWLMEKGSLYFYEDNLDEAINLWSEATELIDALYTKSMSAKISSFLISDQEDVFYGSTFERSLVYYSLSKAYYRRYLNNNDSQDLNRSRAVILAWDSFFQEHQRKVEDNSVYQTDLNLKIFGGFIHELSGIRGDEQIALQLYKDAVTILKTQGGIFKSYNDESEKFVVEFEKILKKKKTYSPDLYKASSVAQSLNEFLHYRIIFLTQKLRPTEVKKEMSFFKINPNVLTEVKKNQDPKLFKTIFVLEHDLIASKIKDEVDIGLRSLMEKSNDSGVKKFIATVGLDLISLFAIQKLGLSPGARATGSEFVFTHHMTRALVGEFSISFEVPKLSEVSTLEPLNVVILNANNEIIAEKKIELIEPLSDVASISLQEEALARYLKIGTRVATKHILAIIAAMTLYRKLHTQKNEGNDYLARLAAFGAYVAAAKGIEAQERADLRQWRFLPSSIWAQDFHLKPGKYNWGIKKSGKDSLVKDLGSFEVAKSSSMVIARIPALN